MLCAAAGFCGPYIVIGQIVEATFRLAGRKIIHNVGIPLQGMDTYPTNRERNLIFPTAFGWDMLVPNQVVLKLFSFLY